MCGNNVSVSKFYIKHKIQCVDCVELHYYNPAGNSTRGKRVTTEEVCAMCYFPGNIVSREEIIRKRDVGGKNPLSVYMHCFNSNVPLPTSGGSSNVRQKKQQTQEKKRKQLENIVSSRKRKGRRSD